MAEVRHTERLHAAIDTLRQQYGQGLPITNDMMGELAAAAICWREADLPPEERVMREKWGNA